MRYLPALSKYPLVRGVVGYDGNTLVYPINPSTKLAILTWGGILYIIDEGKILNFDESTGKVSELNGLNGREIQARYKDIKSWKRLISGYLESKEMTILDKDAWVYRLNERK